MINFNIFYKSKLPFFTETISWHARIGNSLSLFECFISYYDIYIYNLADIGSTEYFVPPPTMLDIEWTYQWRLIYLIEAFHFEF